MIDIEQIKGQIVECLKPLNPDKIILFGSYATGQANEDSDIDLYVVTNDDFLPKDWAEKNAVYLKVSEKIRDIRKIVPVDLIVHTKRMHERFVEIGSSFAREMVNGVNLV